jgi:two-component system phosphate regulon response regulator PhoB
MAQPHHPHATPSQSAKNTPKTRLLVVDDETDLLRLVKYNLELAGFEVFCATTGQEALNIAWTKTPELIILDLMLPDTTGLKLCQELKAAVAERKPQQRTSVIMLTARSAENDRIAGFESGTDDYVTKPFSPKELVLRVKAMLGRHGNTQAPQPQQASTLLQQGPFKVDHNAHKAWVRGEEVLLTPIEYNILSLLLQHANTVRTREQLLADVWEEQATEILDRTVDAHVKRLRSKLGDCRELLETVRGVGYRLSTTEAKG